MMVSNIGFAFTVHFCGDQLASVSTGYTLKANPGKAHSCCGEQIQKASCCKDKVVKVKHKSDNVITKALSVSTDNFYVIPEWKPLVFAAYTPVKKPSDVAYYCDAHAPPLFQLYCQYILYA